MSDEFSYINETLAEDRKLTALEAAPLPPTAEQTARARALEEFIGALDYSHGWTLGAEIEPRITGCWCGAKLDGLDEFNDHLRSVLGAAPAEQPGIGALAEQIRRLDMELKAAGDALVAAMGHNYDALLEAIQLGQKPVKSRSMAKRLAIQRPQPSGKKGRKA